MDIPVPLPPTSAYTLTLGIWLGSALLPLVNLKRAGWRRTARHSLFVLLGVGALTLPTIWMMRVNAVQVSDERIHVQAGYFYETSRPLSDFDLSAAVAGAVRDMPQARLSARLNGTGARGYSAGHFALSGGGQAFVMVTDDRRALFLPARSGASLLISADDPQRLLELLKAQAGTGPAVVGRIVGFSLPVPTPSRLP